MRPVAALLALGFATAAAAETPLPFDVGGPFTLTDHRGATRTQADPEGHPQLLFFGYANCPGICGTALPLMAAVTESLAAQGIALSPVMITVDPARDTPETMGAPLARHHPDLIGLTGDNAALAQAYAAFSVEHTLAYEDPEYGPVYAHGSMIYLMDAAGTVLTLFPPILDPARASEIALGYLAPEG